MSLDESAISITRLVGIKPLYLGFHLPDTSMTATSRAVANDWRSSGAVWTIRPERSIPVASRLGVVIFPDDDHLIDRTAVRIIDVSWHRFDSGWLLLHRHTYPIWRTAALRLSSASGSCQAWSARYEPRWSRRRQSRSPELRACRACCDSSDEQWVRCELSSSPPQISH